MIQSPQMLQHPAEFDALLTVIAELGARSYLEVGAKFGGTLHRIGLAMPRGSTCVAVDMPAGTKVWPESERSLRAVADDLNAEGRPTTVIWGDSTDPKVIGQVREFKSFDVVMIDANHTMPYVRKDWANYGPLATKAVVFHDISWKRDPNWKGTPIHVPQFWNEISGAYHHMAIRLDPSEKNNGIGVILIV